MEFRYIIILSVLFAACKSGDDKTTPDSTATKLIDSTHPIFEPHIHGKDTVDLYSNEVFKNVHVQKTGETTYLVAGQARVFEGVYHYLVRDGNEVIIDGRGKTDAAAPAFGKFSFSVDVNKKTTIDGLYLVLFEVGAKDGSLQHELPIPLIEPKEMD